MIFAIFFALSVAFPASDAKLPPIETCYMIGAAPRGTTNLVVQNRAVDVYHTGAWMTRLNDLVAGTNVITLVANGETNLHSFVIAKKEIATNQANEKIAKIFANHEYASETARAHPRGKENREILIFLDPGHGGADAGALSPHGFTEKDANLHMALAVRRELESREFRVKMTRENDVAIALHERAREAHQVKADAFISIHHNATPIQADPKTRYHAVYAWNALGDKLARAINNEMAHVLVEDIPNKGIVRANFAVTRSQEIPSCLIEIDFLTSPEGEEAVWYPPRRHMIARAIADGLEAWVHADE